MHISLFVAGSCCCGVVIEVSWVGCHGLSLAPKCDLLQRAPAATPRHSIYRQPYPPSRALRAHAQVPRWYSNTSPLPSLLPYYGDPFRLIHLLVTRSSAWRGVIPGEGKVSHPPHQNISSEGYLCTSVLTPGKQFTCRLLKTGGVRRMFIYRGLTRPGGEALGLRTTTTGTHSELLLPWREGGRGRGVWVTHIHVPPSTHVSNLGG